MISIIWTIILLWQGTATPERMDELIRAAVGECIVYMTLGFVICGFFMFRGNK
jgi:hypothetical protein